MPGGCPERWEDLPSTAAALYGLGFEAQCQGRDRSARACLEESLAIRRAVGDRCGAAESLVNLGQLALHDGKVTEARLQFQESLAIRRELADKGGIAASLSTLGEMAQEEGDHAAAQSLFAESLAMFRELGNRMGELQSLRQLGEAAYLLGDVARAMDLAPLHSHWRGSSETGPTRRWHSCVWGKRPGVRGTTRSPHSSTWRACHCGGRGPIRSTAGVLVNLGHAMRFLGDTVRAKSYLEESLSVYRPLHYFAASPPAWKLSPGWRSWRGSRSGRHSSSVWRRCSARGRAARHGLPTGPTMSGT